VSVLIVSDLAKAYGGVRAVDGVSFAVEAGERVALIGTGGISHWPATPDSGKINEKWDRNFLDQWSRCDKEAMLTYTDKDSYLDAGQGAFEIRTFMTISAATGLPGTIHFYEPIPIFAVGCTIATIDLPIVNT